MPFRSSNHNLFKVFGFTRSLRRLKHSFGVATSGQRIRARIALRGLYFLSSSFFHSADDRERNWTSVQSTCFLNFINPLILVFLKRSLVESSRFFVVYTGYFSFSINLLTVPEIPASLSSPLSFKIYQKFGMRQAHFVIISILSLSGVLSSQIIDIHTVSRITSIFPYSSDSHSFWRLLFVVFARQLISYSFPLYISFQKYFITPSSCVA